MERIFSTFLIGVAGFYFVCAIASDTEKEHAQLNESEPKQYSVIDDIEIQSELVLHKRVVFSLAEKKLINQNLEIICTLLESKLGGSARILMAAKYFQSLIDITRQFPKNRELHRELENLYDEIENDLAGLTKLKEESTEVFASLEADQKVLKKIDDVKYDSRIKSLLKDFFEKDAYHLVIGGGSVGAHLMAGFTVGAYIGGGESELGKKIFAVMGRVTGDLTQIGPHCTVGGYQVDLKKGQQTAISKSKDFSDGFEIAGAVKVVGNYNQFYGGEIGIGGVGLTCWKMQASTFKKAKLPFLRNYKMLRRRLDLGNPSARN